MPRMPVKRHSKKTLESVLFNKVITPSLTLLIGAAHKYFEFMEPYNKKWEAQIAEAQNKHKNKNAPKL